MTVHTASMDEARSSEPPSGGIHSSIAVDDASGDIAFVDPVEMNKVDQGWSARGIKIKQVDRG